MQEINGGRIVISPIVSQDPKFQGKIIDGKGDPLPGVSIKEKGSDRSTLTNDKGEFTIAVKIHKVT